jgi:hypothetical protein
MPVKVHQKVETDDGVEAPLRESSFERMLHREGFSRVLLAADKDHFRADVGTSGAVFHEAADTAGEVKHFPTGCRPEVALKDGRFLAVKVTAVGVREAVTAVVRRNLAVVRSDGRIHHEGRFCVPQIQGTTPPLMMVD